MIILCNNLMREKIADHEHGLLPPSGPALAVFFNCPSRRSCCVAICQETTKAEARAAVCRYSADPQRDAWHYTADARCDSRNGAKPIGCPYR